jgi:hypothetical protein
MKLFPLSFLLAAAIGTFILQVQDSGAGANQSPNPEANCQPHLLYHPIAAAVSDIDDSCAV